MARSFNGSSDIINLGTPAALNFTAAFTVSVWANAVAFPGSGTNYAILFGKGFDGTKEQYILRYSGTNIAGPSGLRLMIYYYDGSVHGAEWAYTNVTGTWYNIVGGWDGSTWFLYNNGTSVGTTGGTQVAPTNTSANVSIGAEYVSGSPGRFFNGSIAEVGAWNVGLTAGEIGALARGASPASVRPTALVEYQPLLRDNVSYKLAAPTITGTSVVPHPRIYMPQPISRRTIRSAAVAAPPSFTLMPQSCM